MGQLRVGSPPPGLTPSEPKPVRSVGLSSWALKQSAGSVSGYAGAVPEPLGQAEDATVLMEAAAGGDREAANRLLPLVYEQLRRAAQLELAGERS